MDPRTTLTKKELAKIMGISPRWLNQRMNVTNYNKLKELGYSKRCKILTEEMVRVYLPNWSYFTSVEHMERYHNRKRLHELNVND